MSELFFFNQCLHGYREGHRLIKSSFELPSSTKIKMLRLSDLSGDRVVKGFESYYTGYPIEEISSFAFAKTWYAKEMPRPGCVWTHTIFIDYQYIKHIENLNPIIEHFKKPEDSAFSKYSEIIEIHRPKLKKNKDTTNKDNFFKVLISALLTTSDQIFLIDEFSYERENYLFDSWLFQQPSLRKNFRFCTGSIKDRSNQSDIFDIQIVPKQNANSIQRNNVNSIIINTKEYENRDLNTFLEEIDLSTKKFRKLIWEFGVDEVFDRTQSVGLTKILKFMNYDFLSSETIDDLIQLLIEYFPTNKKAKKLKSFLLGKRSIIKFEDIDFLKILFEKEAFELFSLDDLNLKDILKKGWSSNRNIIVRIVKQTLSSQNKLNEYIIKILCETLSLKDIIYLSKEIEGILPIFISHDPSLAITSEMWKFDFKVRLQMVDVLLQKDDIEIDEWNTIFYTILELSDEKILDIILDKKGNLFLDFYMKGKFSSQDQFSSQSKAVIETFYRSNQKLVLNWIYENKNANIKDILFCISLLNPQNCELDKTSTETWKSIYNNIRFSSESCQEIPIFILSIGFAQSKKSNCARLLINETFKNVYLLAEKNKIDYRSWRIINSFLPSLNLFSDWDRCEKLRRALVYNFVNNNWEVDDLIQIVESKEMGEKIVSFCKSFEEGKKILKKIDSLLKKKKNKDLVNSFFYNYKND